MPTSKCILTNLAIDCLELIVSLLSAYDIGNMWLTGNFRLQFLLSEGGAVRKFYFSHRTTFPLLWPRLIELFPHIVDLSIEAAISDCKHRIFEPNMSTLPSNLRILKFHFVGDLTAFIKSFATDPSRYSKLQVLHLEGERLYGAVPVPDLSSIKELGDFRVSSYIKYGRPVLRGLVLPLHITELNVSLEDVSPSVFPSSLTRLSLVAPASLSFWSMLPRGLSHLSVAYSSALSGTEPAFDVQHLPPHLISLSVTLQRLTPEITLQLPRSLKHLRFDHIAERIQAFEPILRNLPPSLETLEGLEFPYTADMNLLLPRSLSGSAGHRIRLENLPVNFTSLILPEGPLELLQRFTRLTYLELDLIDSWFNPNLDEFAKYLPPSLKSLRLIGPKPIQDFPPRLTSLEVSRPMTPSEWKHLPRDLTSLILFAHFTPIDWNLDCLREMPPNITIFHLGGSASLPKGALDVLPLSLTDLRFPLQEVDVGWFIPLSKFINLRTLHIEASGCEIQNARAVIQNLPRRLTDLKLRTARSDLENADLQEYLPPGLTSLVIDDSPNVQFDSMFTTSPAAMGLPPYLDHFTPKKFGFN